MRRGVLIAGLLALCRGDAGAYSLKALLQNRLDPAPRYRTIKTGHFEVHYPEELEEAAARIAETAERIHPKVAGALRWKDRGTTHIVVAHKSDQTGVFTLVYPHRQIFYDAALPHQGIGLNDYGDWHEWLLTHEFAHVAHLETLGGAYQWLAPVFGSWVRPNQATPTWLKEGLATYLESTLTPHGRGESNAYRMMVRMAAADGILEDPDFAAPDTIATFDRKSWPWTLRPYLFGYYLIRELERERPGAIADLVRTMGRSFPYRLGPALRAAGADSFKDLWKRTLAGMRREAERDLENIRAEPLTPLEHITNTGHFYFGPRVSPDGKWLVAARDHPYEENAVIKFDLDGDAVSKPERLFYRSTGYQSSFSKSSRFLVFDQVERSRRYYLVSDLYIYDLKTRAISGASPYFRARDPDVHPDGKHVVFVANVRGKNRLFMTDTAWNNPEDLLGDVGYRRLSGPRFSPDGKTVALSVHDEKTGGEDLWLVGPRGPKVLVSDGARNRSPEWTPDGKWILYSSDETGVFNIHAVDPVTGERRRLTNVLGGLFYPAVDPAQRWVYAVSYGGRGYDLARLRWDPASWREEPPVRPSAPEPAPPPSREQKRLAGSSKPYSGLAHLAAQYLTPSLVLRPDSVQSGARVGAVDPLFFHNYELDLRYDTATRVPVGRLFYYNGVFPWAFDLELEKDAVPLSGSAADFKTTSLRASLDIPLGVRDSNFFLRPGISQQTVKFAGSTDYSGTSLGLRYDTEFLQLGHTFPEAGSYFEAGAEQWVESPAGDIAATAVTGTLRRHFALGLRRHALHLSLAGGGYVAGQSGANTFFFAGGERSFPLDLESPLLIYGYRPNSLFGTGLAVGGVQYTFALKDIQRGLVRAPLLFGRLSAALRAQAAVLSPQPRPGLPWSWGAELYQDIDFGYIFDLTARLGAYRGDPAHGGETQFLFSLSGRFE